MGKINKGYPVSPVMQNLNMEIKNKQKSVALVFGGLTVVFILLTLLPFFRMNLFSGKWAFAFMGIFFSISSFIIAMIFKNRAKKMKKLLSGEKLIVQLKLNNKMLQQYAETLRKESTAKNKAVMWVIGVLFAVVAIPFLFFLEKDEIGGFLLIIASILFLVFSASRFFPFYYYLKNRNGDGQILIGEKFVYINGYFHNWDFPMSGLSKAKAIKKPFRGIYLAYYYTDRTWKHVHEIKFPIPEDFNPEPVLSQLCSANSK